MNTFEILATIIVVIAVIKLIAIVINPKKWIDFSKALLGSKLTRPLATVLAAIVLYYLIQAGITIIEIFAVMVFFALFIVIGIAPYMSKLYKSIKIGDIWRTQWWYIILWLALMIWAIIELI